jgi:DNA repair exonuclease SbcCD ATPase subunit
LTGKQKEAFEKEAGKWKSTVVLRETIEKAQRKPEKRGFFDEADWIEEVSRNNRWDSRYGTGPLNKTARTLEFNLGQAQKSIAKRASNLGKVKAKIIESELKSHRNKLASSLAAIDSKLGSKKAALSRNPQLSSEIAQDISRKEKYSAEIAQLDQNLARLKELRSVKNPSWFYTLAATGILSGLALGGQTGALTAAAIGTAAGRGLSSPTAQRTVAGQTQAQQKIQQFLQNDRTGRTADILGRAGGVIGSRSGMFTQ